MSKRIIWTIVGIVAAIGCTYCVGVLAYQHVKQNEIETVYEQVSTSGSAEDSSDQTEEPAEAEAEHDPVEIPIDFAALKKVNEDIYAWIEIPGTNIEYPILQNPDDDLYYLNRTPDKKEVFAGSIFTQHYNSTDFTDPNTVIYGHCMRNDTMFTQLHKFSDADFFAENRTIIIYTPTQKLTYQVFAAYPYDDRHLLYYYDFDDPAVFASYIREIFAIRDMRAQIDASVAVGTDSKLITLSTCMQDDNTRRYLVQAVLTSVEG